MAFPYLALPNDSSEERGKKCREKGLESQLSETVSNFVSCKILFEILNVFLFRLDLCSIPAKIQ